MLKTKSKQGLGEAIALPRPRLIPVTTLLNRQYWWSTLLVLVGMAVLIRLGFWQLDRLSQRQARNAEIAHQLALPPLLLTGQSMPDDLTGLKHRRVSAHGEFDFSHQIGLKLQNWMGAPGIHLVTPLVVEGSSQAVLVDRGWIPSDQAAPENWSQFDEPGPVTVIGFVQLSQTLPNQSGSSSQTMPTGPQSEWYRVDVEAIQTQMPYELLPIYVLQSPPDDNSRLPYRTEPEFDLSDGPHLGYAIQWYIFALILGIMYVRYVSKGATARPVTDKGSEEAT